MRSRETPEFRPDGASVRRLGQAASPKLHVSRDAEKWLQARASTLGLGGIGKGLVSLYPATKVAYAKGDETIMVEHLEDVADLSMGYEDVERVSEAVAESFGMRRVV